MLKIYGKNFNLVSFNSISQNCIEVKFLCIKKEGGGVPVSSRLRQSSEKYSGDMFFLGGTMYDIFIINKNVKARIIF